MSYPLPLPTNDALITVTHPTSNVWVIELHNGDDSRLTKTLVDHGLKPALDQVERHWRDDRRGKKGKEVGRGAVVIVGNTKQDKFFSNGLDYENIVNDPNFFPLTFNPLLTRLLTFPLPIVAAINGHCFAGGMMISLACDYRVMTDGSKRNAWMCMNEVHFGAPWPLSFASVLRAKFSDVRLQRRIALEGHRFTPAEALKVGLVDHLVQGGDTAAVLEKAIQVAEAASELAKTGVWGLIKRDLYRDAVESCERDIRPVTAAHDDAAAKARL